MLFVRLAGQINCREAKAWWQSLEDSKNFVERSAKTRDELFFTHTKNSCADASCCHQLFPPWYSPALFSVVRKSRHCVLTTVFTLTAYIENLVSQTPLGTRRVFDLFSGVTLHEFHVSQLRAGR